MRNILTYLFILIFCSSISAQKSSLEVSGYIKNLQTFFISSDLDNPLTGNMLFNNQIHNYTKIDYRLKSKWQFYAAARTRIYMGDFVRFGAFTGGEFGSFRELIEDVDNDEVDLTWVLIDKNPTLAHLLIDRAYGRYSYGDWEITLGRQRINWGIHSVWNPNDLFNAYNFVEFDYEERRGSDALRVVRYLGDLSSIEFAGRISDNWDESILGLLYRFNKSNVDYQVLAAKYLNDVSLGFGLAGNIKTAIFKTEWTGFISTESGESDALVGSWGIEYSTNSGYFLQFSFLYNSNGESELPVTDVYNLDISPKNLYPYTFSMLAQTAKTISPLLSASLTVVYSPSPSHPVFLSPGMTVSIAEDWDFDVIGQISFNKEENFRSPLQALFLRLKFSY